MAAELVAQLGRVAEGDAQALRAVYGATSAKLFAVCLRILNDRGEAEEVLQEVYLTVWRRAHVFDQGRGLSPMTWLLTIARNRSIDRLRSTSRVRAMAPLEAAGDPEDAAPSALDRLEVSDERRRLEGCLRELEGAARTAIRTSFFEGATYPELAQRMNVPLGTLKSWVRRGLLKLRVCLER